MKARRGVFASASSLCAAALAFAAPSAAATHRPYDAPAAQNGRAVVPPLPTGYLEHNEAGVTFAYHPSAHERVRASISTVLRTRAAMSEELGREVLPKLDIRVAAVPEEMRSLGPTEDVPSYAPALVFSKERLIVTSLGSPRSLEPTDLATTLRHALGHAALDEAADHKPVPLWLHEGYAVHVAGDAAAMRAEALVVATLKKRLIPLAALEASFPPDAPETSLAYAEAADLVRFLIDKPRRASFAAAIEHVRAGEPFERALSTAYEADLATIEQSWRKDLGRRHGFLPVFLVGIGVWALAAIVIFMRRMAERRRVRPAEPSRRPLRVQPAEPAPAVEPLRPAPETRERAPLSAPPSGIAAEREGMGQPMVPETEVPKVEVDGDWHTLH
jgi:hypothetical protein